MRLNSPAHTVLMVTETEAQSVGSLHKEHPSDSVQKGSIIVIQTPPNIPNAVWGGLAASRAVVKGSLGVITDGRCRDLPECTELGFPVFCRGISTVGMSLNIHFIYCISIK